YNYLPVPALARAEFNHNGSLTIAPAFARARAEGSWSDRLELSSALFSQPLSVDSITTQDNDFLIRVRNDRSNKLAAGDLLRLNFVDGQFAFLPVAKVSDVTGSPPPNPPLLEARATKSVWFMPLQNINAPT